MDILTQVYKELAEKRKGKVKKRLPEPIIRVQKRKTMITNIDDICQTIEKPIDEVCDFIRDETGSNVINTTMGLLIGSRLTTSDIASVLKKYIEKYISCSECQSTDTKREKQGKNIRIVCNDCKALSIKRQ